MNTDKLFRIAVLGLSVLCLFFLMTIGHAVQQFRANTPEARAQQAKQEQAAKQAALLKKQSEEIELQHVMNSPAFRKQMAEMTLGRQFPRECGRGVRIVADDGKGFVARCDYSDSEFTVGPLSNGGWIAMRCGARCR